MKNIKTYTQAIDYIYSKLPIFQRQGPKALKYDLSNITNFCSRIGNPQDKLQTIHIAGTNGKGTTSHILASIFQQAGYKTGLYTSPHYKDFRERIKINGKFIRKSSLTGFISTNQKLIEELKPTYFELSVAMAFDYFAKQKVDIAIIEVGLGGRLDSTNIITPLLSIITNISFDHTQTLGNTLAEIAAEKAGIIKNNIPVVIGDKQTECNPVYNKIAKKKNAPVYYADDLLEVNEIKQNLKCKKFSLTPALRNIDNIKTDILGPFSHKNIKYSLAAIDVFLKYYSNWRISKEDIIKGVRRVKNNTKYIGRWHIISKKPLMIADGAHNVGAMKETMEYIKQIKHNNLHIILGVVADKEWDKTMQLLPKKAIYYFTKADIPRAMNENDLRTEALKSGLKGNTFEDIHKAKQAVLKVAKPEDLILVLGSIYLVGEII